MAADAGIFEKQESKKMNKAKRRVQRSKNTSSSTRGLDLFSFFARVISLSHPVSAVGFMNTPVSVVREDAMPILCVNA